MQGMDAEFATELASPDSDREGADSRAALIDNNLELARIIAAKLYKRRVVDTVEFDDYLQLAYTGLLEAAERFDETRGVQFSSFASYRIRGAVLNGLPSYTEAGNQLAYWRRAESSRMESLLQEDPSADATSHFSRLVDTIVGLAVSYSLDDLADLASDQWQAPAEHGPYASHSFREMQVNLLQSVAELPQRERHIIEYHYFHQVSFDALADILGVTKGRVSQLHKQALQRLRSYLGSEHSALV